MNPNQLDHSKLIDIAVIELEDLSKVLILLCEDEYSAEKLMDVLSSNNYKIDIILNASKEAGINIAFSNKYRIFLPTDKTILNYHPIKWLCKGEVRFVTVGWLDDTRRLVWIDNHLPLDRPLLN